MKAFPAVLIAFFLFFFSFPKSYAQNTELWGLTMNGGAFGAGTMFKADANGNNDSLVLSMGFFAGTAPLIAEPCFATNGKLYGVTVGDGNYGRGVLYQFDPKTGSYKALYHFGAPGLGTSPYASLIQASNGKIYGATYSGGAYGKGILYSFDPGNGVFTNLKDLDDSTGYGIYGRLLEASNGKIYGGTVSGGRYGAGVLFEFDPATDSLRRIHDFNGSNNGGMALFGSLMQASNGKVYGMTISGGASGNGSVFRYDIGTDSFSKEADFTGSSGSAPRGRLCEVNGKLYGMTSGGGTYGNGVLFEFDTSTRQIMKKMDFDGINTGSSPYGSLAFASNGNLYGLTNSGGANGIGVFFEYNLSNDSFIKKLDFNGAASGSYPYGSLGQFTDGKLYGMASGGGTNGAGTIFSYNLSKDTFLIELSFREPLAIQPTGSMVQLSNGKLFGMSYNGGKNYQGTLFEMDPVNGSFFKRIDFDGAGKGKNPWGNDLTVADNGKIYGITRFGGANDLGVLFEYDPNTILFRKILDFDGAAKGAYPLGKLIQANDGKLYGTTQSGGTHNFGVIYSYDPASDSIVIVLNFDGTNSGEHPVGTLLQADNGLLYGMSGSGINYPSFVGSIFSFDLINQAYSEIHVFDGTGGARPEGGLIQATNGRLYGLTSEGGTGNKGVIFEYDLDSGLYHLKYSFDFYNNKGYSPHGSLIQARNGNLYGMTSDDYSAPEGKVFEYDLLSDSMRVKFSVTNFGGGNPRGDLVEICFPNAGTDSVVACDQYTWIDSITYTSDTDSATFTLLNSTGCDSVITLHLRILRSSYDTINPVVCNEYTSPSGKYTWTMSNTYLDTLVNQYGCDSVLSIYLTVNSSSADSIYPEACFSYISPSGKYTWTNSGTYLDTLVNQLGCDSFLTIFLTIDTVDVSVGGVSPTFSANALGATYRWLDCTANYLPIPGANSRSFTAAVNGTYAVEVTLNSCTDTSECVLVYNVGLNESKSLFFLLYPNPNNGDFNIEYAGDLEMLDLRVLNALGQLVQAPVFIESNRIRVYINQPGLYTIQLFDRLNGSRAETKVIVE
ncbi:MAG TPA: hypothetical protein DIW47_03405 [Bacteroidetes bacterium]|nr:hypothetical protein [Bacteroidota bacterium]